MTEARSIDEVLCDPHSTAEIHRAVDTYSRREWPARARVHALRNFTLETALPALQLAGYQRGVRIDASLSAFDAYRQDALSSDGDVVRADAVLIWLWLEAMPMAWGANGQLDEARAADEIFSVIDDVSARTPAPIFVHTFVAPLTAGAGWDGHDALDSLNRRIRERARSDAKLHLVDIARIAAELGRNASIDARFALMHRAPVSSNLARLWGDAVAQGLSSRAGRLRKVLVVDADETLWGGIAGEDGSSGIRLSRDTYPGSAYHLFQRELLALRSRGVLLALASKNDPETVYEILDSHPSCLLRREHFAAMRIGWGPKSESIRAISEELNLGLDAFVFVDDSPVECAEVKTALPMVEVLRVPREPHRVASLLAGVRLFDGATATREDTLRADHYNVERERTEARAQYADLDSFLSSLELEADFSAPTASEIARIAQLTQRTNQWNLTTHRYDVADVERMHNSDRFHFVALRVRDRYGDYGLTGLGIVAFDDEGGARIDSLLMSCRTLGRKLEDALLAEVLRSVRELAPSAKVVAQYRATPKNAQVASFFDERGFSLVTTDEGTRSYLLTDPSAVVAPPFIRTRRDS